MVNPLASLKKVTFSTWPWRSLVILAASRLESETVAKLQLPAELIVGLRLEVLEI